MAKISKISKVSRNWTVMPVIGSDPRMPRRKSAVMRLGIAPTVSVRLPCLRESPGDGAILMYIRGRSTTLSGSHTPTLSKNGGRIVAMKAAPCVGAWVLMEIDAFRCKRRDPAPVTSLFQGCRASQMRSTVREGEFRDGQAGDVGKAFARASMKGVPKYVHSSDAWLPRSHGGSITRLLEDDKRSCLAGPAGMSRQPLWQLSSDWGSRHASGAGDVSGG
jgi:hypothetical protein